MPLAVLGWLMATRPSSRWLRLGSLTVGFGLGAAVAIGLFDLVTWDRPFASLVEFTRYTLVERQASAEVAEQPLLWYLRRLPRWLPLSLLPLLWFVPSVARPYPIGVDSHAHRAASSVSWQATRWVGLWSSVRPP